MRLSSWMRAWRRRAVNGWRVLFSRGDVTALLLASGVLILPALALRAAAWTVGLEQLLPVAVLSVLLGFLLARSHYEELLALVMSGIYGAVFIGLITALNMAGGTLGERFADLAARVVAWLEVLFGEGVSQDNLIFVLFLSVLFWFLGHNTAWHVFRLDRVWRAIIPPGLVILVNAFYYTGPAPLGAYMAVFVVLALLLIVRSNIEAYEWRWYLNRINFPPQMRRQFLAWGAVLAFLLVGVAWVLPNGADSENLQRIQEFLNRDPLGELNKLFNRLFAALESEGLATADYYGGNSLQLGGAIQLGNQTVMLVQTPRLDRQGVRYYWRSRTFGFYAPGLWTPTAAVRLTAQEPGFVIEDAPVVAGARQVVRQQVTMVLGASRLVYAAPQPAVLDLPVSIDLTYVNNDNRQADVSVIRPLRPLHNGDVYTVSSAVSVADASALRGAGLDYPQWVLATYLQLGSSVTQRTRDLAVQIVRNAGASTPYDQAKAIETWLRSNIAYQETIPGAPPGIDPVDWVVFEDRRGYCNYYASAMIVMLRSLGVPARLAAGFSQGEWDEASQAFLVRERDAHTWVEVYFPGYGWVEYEPTAAQAPLNRPDAILAAQDLGTFTPPPTNTPLPTATPTLTPTLLQTSTPDPLQGPAPVIPPTVTLTPTITPTPFIPPTVSPPATQEQQPLNIVTMILSAVLTVLMVLFVLVVLLMGVLFLIWWIEWRGMGGLTPTQRAYALLGRYAGYVGITLPPNYTPHERRRVLADRIPRGDQPFRVITDMYVEETYAPQRRRGARWSIAARNAWNGARQAFLRKRLERLIPRRWR
jgi:transglutaminase-like putative cysteine protease